MTSDAEKGGNVDILSYNIQWDAGTGGDFADIVGNAPSQARYTETTVTLTSSIVAGSTYRFRIRAENIHGQGSFSSIVPLKAAGVPLTMDSPVTYFDNTNGDVIVAWSAPTSDGYEAISSYTVLFATSLTPSTSDTTTYKTLAACDGSSATVKSVRTCYVPMATIRSQIATLTTNSPIKIAIYASNSKGSGTPSAWSNGNATIRVAPTGTLTVTVVQATDAAIKLTWDAMTLPNAGYSPILTYSVYMDQTTENTITELVQDSSSTSLELSSSQFTAGNRYHFKIIPHNIYGAGPNTLTDTVYAYTTTGKVDIPSVYMTATTDTTVKISWSEPSNGGNAIYSYNVNLKMSDGNYWNITACATAASRICSVSMADIITNTGLTVDRLIQARVRAINFAGEGAWTELNVDMNGQTIETLP